MIHMEAVETYKHTVSYLNASCDVFVIKQRGTFDFYAAPSDGSFPLTYMFGVPVESCTTNDDAMELAVTNAGDYIPTFLLEDWA